MPKERFVLPFNDSRMFSNYYMDFPHSIVSANSGKNYEVLISDKYINCYFQKTYYNNWFFLGEGDHWFQKNKAMVNQHIKILKSTLAHFNDSLPNLVKNAILSGMYIVGKALKNYIDVNLFVEDAVCDFLIVGFDNNKEVFLIEGLAPNYNRFSGEIRYKNFIDSLCATSDGYIYIDFWKYNKDSECSLDVKDIALNFYKYIHSIKIDIKNISVAACGIEAIEQLKNEITSFEGKSNKYKEALINDFCKHKFFINHTLSILFDLGIVEETYICYSKKAYEISKECIEILKKYELTSQEELLILLEEKVESTITLEKEYIPKLIDRILSISDI